MKERHLKGKSRKMEGEMLAASLGRPIFTQFLAHAFVGDTFLRISTGFRTEVFLGRATLCAFGACGPGSHEKSAYFAYFPKSFGDSFEIASTTEEQKLRHCSNLALSRTRLRSSM